MLSLDFLEDNFSFFFSFFSIFHRRLQTEDMNDPCTYQIGDKEANEALIEGIQHCNNKSRQLVYL